MIGLLQFTTNVTGIQRRRITGGLDKVRGFKKRADESGLLRKASDFGSPLDLWDGLPR